MSARSRNYANLIISAVITIFGSSIITTTALGATDAESKKIESVLDKLEQRLIDKEASPLTYDESNDSQQPEKKSPKAKQRYAPSGSSKISGKTPSSKNIGEIQKKINEYDNQIEILESDIRRLKAGVYENSVTDNHVSLQVKTAESSKFIIRTLNARLDGNTLFNQMDAAGLWMPARSVPIFYGPLQPGEHRIDISATIAPLSADGLEMPTWKQKGLQQSFSFTIPDGKARKSISIEISDAKGDGSQPSAKLAEADTK